MRPSQLGFLPSLRPRGPGHRFVVYGDACSGVPGALHERAFAQVNSVLARLEPQPEFVIFTGDEIAGLTDHAEQLLAQCRHFLDTELRWPGRPLPPVFHVTGNHTTYDKLSEGVFRDVLRMPTNGPVGQEGLSYWVRRGDLLLVAVHTLWSGLGGEGHVETEWLRETLRQNGDARYKLVAGHHPVFPVNGFSGAYQREIGPEHGAEFWDVLVEHGVTADLGSHLLAFDVQVHRGVLQVTTAGAGTAHRMPEGIEYLHAVDMAVDAQGLRYRVLDPEGRVRECLSWPLRPDRAAWRDLPSGELRALIAGEPRSDRVVAFRFQGTTGPQGTAVAQTLLSTHPAPGDGLASLWLGLAGPGQRLTVILAPEPGRSPHTWHGPSLGSDRPFSFEVVVHAGMGPGGLLVRLDGEEHFSSLAGASAWGAERLPWPERWSVGHGQRGSEDRAFLGPDLAAAMMELADD